MQGISISCRVRGRGLLEYPLRARAGSVGLAIAGVKSGKVGQRKLSVSRATVVADQWSMVRAGGRAVV